MNTIPTTMQEAIERKIMQAISDIKFYIREGIDREAAIKMVMDRSTLGPASIARIMQEIN